MYHEISTFEKEFHKGDHDNGFLTIKSGLEMTIYLSNSLFQDNVVDPVNHHRRLYFSLLYDGSSSSKVDDEKVLYVIKSCQNVSPKIVVLSLQEPEDTSAEGLHVALKKAITNANLMFPRQDRMVVLDLMEQVQIRAFKLETILYFRNLTSQSNQL